MFRQILGQDHVVSLLSKQIENDRVAQAYLFHGSDGVGKYMTALFFAMGLNCLSLNEYKPCGVCNSCHKFLSYEHPDFVYLFPTTNLQMSVNGEIKSKEALKLYEGFLQNKIYSPWKDFSFGASTEIRKESVMMLSKRLELSSVEAKYRVVIIENADLMNVSTANAFLKKLEEPPPSTIIILITEKISMVLPTIISRCQQIYFKPLSSALIEKLLADKFDLEFGVNRSAARIAGGSFKEAAKLCSPERAKTRELSFSFFKWACINDQLALHTFVSKGKDFIKHEELLELIRFLTALMSDISIYPYDPKSITNIDQLDLILDVTSNHPVDHDDAVVFLVQAQELARKARGNVSLSLIIIDLFYSLKSALYQSK